LTRAIEIDRSEDGTVIVVLRGEHESFTAPKLEQELDAVIADGLSVVVDLSEATFLDSSVVSVLLRAREELQERGQKLFLVLDDTTGWAVRRLLEVTGLANVFAVAPSRDVAVGAARSTTSAG